MSVQQIADELDLEKYAKNKTSVIHFYADWSTECQHMSTLFEEMSKQDKYKPLVFARCVAEDLPNVSLAYNVSAVPTFVIVKNLKLVDRVDGADPESLDKKLVQQVNSTNHEQPAPSSEKQSLEERLKQLVSKHKVMVFMKGDRHQPRCGFSKTLIEILNETKLPYETFDILQDEEVRQGLKTFSNWPTYPQVYVKGELVGGLDIVRELKDAKELEKTLNPLD